MKYHFTGCPALVRRQFVAALYLGLLFTPFCSYAEKEFIEDLTWVEVNNAVKAGKTVAIVPTGGTEQNGPHMITGKHNYIVAYTAGEIAKKLGNALVTPVMAYVPEGAVNPPEGHMRFAGTMSLKNETFEAILEDVASSLKQHGFKIICFVGEHGASQRPQQAVADKLSIAWATDGVKVINISNYYSNKNGQDDYLSSLDLKVEEIGNHATLSDTSELLAVKPDGVRSGMMKRNGGGNPDETGVVGDPSKSTAEIGEHLLLLKVDAAVKQIQSYE